MGNPISALLREKLVTASVATATAVVSLGHTATAAVGGEERSATVAAEEKKDDDNYPRIVVTAHKRCLLLNLGYTI